MAKVSYATLKLKTNTDVDTFDFNGNQIEVLKYLPIADKYDLIAVTMQKAEQDGTYNELMLDMYFHLHLVYLYTNLSFTDKQREDEMKIYDCLCSTGFMDRFISILNDEEYHYLRSTLQTIVANKVAYNSTIAATVRKVIDDLPKNAEAAAKLVENFNPEKYAQVINFANAVGAPVPQV